SGVPFMNRTTGFSEISFSIRSRAFAIGWVLTGAESQGPRLHGVDIARGYGPRQRIPQKEALSAAGGVHMAVNGRRRRSGDDEIVTFGLTLDAPANCLNERLIGRGAAQRLTQIDRILLAETHIERAG